MTDLELPNKGRRQFLGGLLAAGVVPQVSWADAGSPAFLSAAAKPDGSFVLCGMGEDLLIRFELPLPARGHAAAAHPTRPEAVAFARRPGTFAVVIDCVKGTQIAALASPEGRHFYGHGAFSSDGRLLFTTENDYELGRGRIGVWDTQNGYARIDEWDSGGIGPHDIKRLPGTDILVVANGGIDTHPDTGRTKLNIATMAPNLAYVETGHVIDTVSLAPEWHKNSIRHLDVSEGGAVAFGMQWQGDGPAGFLIGTHSRDSAPEIMKADSQAMRNLENYIGSIAFSADGGHIAATSPHGGALHVYDVLSSKLTNVLSLPDTCGISYANSGFVATSGTGLVKRVLGNEPNLGQTYDMAWDNHLVRI